eukprot:SAG11_NODE_372_length_10036_cov_8.820871_5_plen_159_part_00
MVASKTTLFILFGLLGLLGIASASAANPKCLAALDSNCLKAKGTVDCDGCLLASKSALKAAGCRTIDEEKWCGDSPKPKPINDQCMAVLGKECAAEQRAGEAKCDQCVEKVDRTKKLNCSHVEELKFCDQVTTRGQLARSPAPCALCGIRATNRGGGI